MIVQPAKHQEGQGIASFSLVTPKGKEGYIKE